MIQFPHPTRDAIGLELEPRWAELAAANTGHARRHGATGTAIVVTGDARQLPHLLDPALAGRVALVLTSPPYGRSLHGQVAARPGRGVAKFDDVYSADPANLGRVNPSVLLEALEEILVACQQLLQPGGVLALTARPYRHRDLLVDLPGQLTQVAEAAGLMLFERNAALLVGLREDRLVPRPSFFQLDQVRKARARGRSPSRSSPTKTSSSFAGPQQPRIEDERAARMATAQVHTCRTVAPGHPGMLGPRQHGSRRPGRRGHSAHATTSNRRPSDYEPDARRRPGRHQTDLACSRWIPRRSRRIQVGPVRSSG
jgi:hypothetical protein